MAGRGFSAALDDYLAEILLPPPATTGFSAGTSPTLAAMSVFTAAPHAVAIAEDVSLSEAPQLRLSASATAVPEPCAALLCALAAAALAVRRPPRRCTSVCPSPFC